MLNNIVGQNLLWYKYTDHRTIVWSFLFLLSGLQMKHNRLDDHLSGLHPQRCSARHLRKHMVNLLQREWRSSDVQCFSLLLAPQAWSMGQRSDHIMVLFQPEDAGSVPARGFLNYHTRWCVWQCPPATTEVFHWQNENTDPIIAEEKLSSLFQSLFTASVNVDFLK